MASLVNYFTPKAEFSIAIWRTFLSLNGLVLIVAFLFSNESNALTTIGNDDFPAWDLADICEVYIDDYQDQSIETVSAKKGQPLWNSCQGTSLSRGYSDETVWLKFSFNYTGIGKRPIYIHLPVPWLSGIKVFQASNANEFNETSYGSELPFKARAMQGGGFFIPIELQPNRANDVYMRVSSRGALTIGGQVLSEQGASHKNLMNTLFVGFLVGGIALLSLFSLFVFVILRDKNYLNYLLFNLSVLVLCGTIYGYNYQFLWPELIAFNLSMNAATIAATTFFMLIFTRRFLEIRFLAPRADTFLVSLLGLSVIGFFVSFVGYFHSIIITAVTALASVGLVFVAILGVFAWFRRVAAAGYFFVAFFSSIGGMSLIAALAQGLLEYSHFSYYALGVGALIEIALLSLALVGRIRGLRLEKDEAQKKLAENLNLSRFELEKKVIERTVKLETATRRAELLARTDPLTGLNNRRAFFDYGEMLGRQRETSVARYAIVMIDLDHFKAINDNYGHRVGDEALREVANTILSTMRDADIAGRIGGEEFAIILPRTSVAAAEQLAERLRKSVSEIVVQAGSSEVRLTTSVGVAECGPYESSIEDALSKADQALYRAKENGRDRVFVAND
ncbi:MAG: diguanylate cyclase (GGDEF)-like protein [Oceanicoccus sp.]|jgi:diguanylate cyclase (GGDEF)-like protein